jgi:membrane protein YdbS with pleckstrin-like domain
MVESYYLTLFTLTAVIVALMAMDANVAAWIDLQFRWFVVRLKRRWYIITIGTMVKYQTWKMKREINKIRKEHGIFEDGQTK